MATELDKEVVQIIGKPKKSEIAGFGTVKFYANEPNKQFGFMSSESEDVFFHGSRCYQLANNGTDLPGLTHASKTVEQSLIDPPKRGDTILFVAESGPRGLRATRWVKWSEDILETVLDEIVEQPKYQLIERIGPAIKEGELVLGSEKRLIVRWEGQELPGLRFEYSQKKYPCRENETGALFFKVFNQETQEWVICPDPR